MNSECERNVLTCMFLLVQSSDCAINHVKTLGYMRKHELKKIMCTDKTFIINLAYFLEIGIVHFVFMVTLMQCVLGSAANRFIISCVLSLL